MKKTILALCAATLAGPALAAAHAEVDAETVAAIEAMLTEMNCQMDPDDIEAEDDGGYELDDVICQGGDQFDIVLDADLNVIERRAE